MVVSQHGELAAPYKSDADTTEKGHELVAAVLATFEAVVGISPNTVRRSDAFWFSKQVFKVNLQKYNSHNIGGSRGGQGVRAP